MDTTKPPVPSDREVVKANRDRFLSEGKTDLALYATRLLKTLPKKG
jgi:hypothetical protein